MNTNIIQILIISLIIALLIIIGIKCFKRSPQLSDEEINDYIIDLWVNFEEHTIEKYTKQQLVVISIIAYDSEINNGGLNQFFSNSSRIFAAYISNSLEQINAKKHQKQFDKFVAENKIDVNKLDLFVSNDINEFIKQYDNYSFSAFDKEYYKLEKEENLSNLIIEYAKNNYDEIFTDIK